MKKNCLLIICLYNTIINYGQVNLIIDYNKKLDSSTNFMQGFLHGNPRNLDSIKVSQLKPAYWRIGAYALAGSSYEDAIRFNPKITININDYFMILHQIGSQTLSKPWENNWYDWDSTVSFLARNTKKTNSKVDYWDAWGEPDNFWTGNYSQWIEMYRRTDSILNSILSNPQLIGPEFGFGNCLYSINPILKFVDSLKDNGVIIDGISWHEMCKPEDVLIHVNTLRDSLKNRTWLNDVKILIPEYAGPSNSTIPGWNIGWLFYLEKSKVDWVSHACWDETDGTISWSNCEHGLNGLFMKDNVTPQPNYWVHRYYAELGSKRLDVKSNATNTVALCGINLSKKEFNVLVGHYDNPNLGQHNNPKDIDIQIKNYPYCSNCSIPVMVKKIKSNDVSYSLPMLNTKDSFYGFALVKNDSIKFSLKDFTDGDAMLISFNANNDSMIKSNKKISHNYSFDLYPNPNNGKFYIKLYKQEETEIEIYNYLGKFIRKLQVKNEEEIKISDLDKGLYFLKNSNVYTKKLIVY